MTPADFTAPTSTMRGAAAEPWAERTHGLVTASTDSTNCESQMVGKRYVNEYSTVHSCCELGTDRLRFCEVLYWLASLALAGARD